MVALEVKVKWTTDADGRLHGHLPNQQSRRRVTMVITSQQRYLGVWCWRAQYTASPPVYGEAAQLDKAKRQCVKAAKALLVAAALGG